jgi:HSP20 family protein
MFDRMRGEFGATLSPPIAKRTPFIDLTEAGDNLILRAEIPGANPKDLEVDIDDDMLTIRGEIKQDIIKDSESYHRIERSYGSFSRAIKLPCRVVIDDVKAAYKKGVLKIVMPKCPPEKARKIRIKLK